MSRPIPVRGVVFRMVLVVSAGLGTAIGSADNPDDEWGCPANRIGHSVYTPSDGGGSDSQADVLMLLAPFLAADGQRSEAEYADALASATGPDRFESLTGKVYIDDRIEAQIAFAQLSDGTWTLGNLWVCGPLVPPDLASPGAALQGSLATRGYRKLDEGATRSALGD